MLIEYTSGAGEKLVSGQIQAKNFSTYWNNTENKTLPHELSIPNFLETFQALEKHYNSPQDIEWCLKTNAEKQKELFILQSRPITTISSEQYKSIQYLEKNLTKSQPFFHEKTEISEIAPNPWPLTLSLLQSIYQNYGPIQSVYQKYKIKYQDTKFLQLIGNELFVDKEKELQSLLPSYTHFKSHNFTPKISFKSKKIITSFLNSFRLNLIKTDSHRELETKLKKAIQTIPKDQNFKQTLKKFLRNYELIFEINLLARISNKNLQIILKKEGINEVDLYQASRIFLSKRNSSKTTTPPKKLIGNSLDFQDQSPFRFNPHQDNPTSIQKIQAWWTQLNQVKQKYYQDRIIAAIKFNQLRESARILTVIHLNQLRKSAHELTKNLKFKNPDLIYFATIEELKNNKIQEETYQKRKGNFESQKHLKFPSQISSVLIKSETELLSLSNGIATGILQTRESLEQAASKSKTKTHSKIILYTEILSPDLTQYFDQISGIISHKGGQLSHLAIIAREEGLPAISGFNISDQKNIQIGDNVTINGGNATIEKTKT